MKLLIVEDEHELSQNVATYMSAEKYVCEQAFSYKDAIDKISIYEYDCILLDLMLPDGNGLDVLKFIKKQNNPAGVIIVSAKNSLDDKIAGIKIGADDYLAKPFHLSELSVRIYAIIRRRQFDNNNIVTSGNLEINLLKKDVYIGETPITLTKSEYDLLLFLIGNKNSIISKGAIAEHLSGDMADMLDNQDFIYAHIKNLKSKLAKAGCTSYVKNVYGTGYKWIE